MHIDLGYSVRWHRTFNNGGKLYSDIAFGQLEQYYQKACGQVIPR
jgi:hypothetical protein